MLQSSVYLPKKGLVEDLVSSVEYYLSIFINVADVYLIFDRYLENSIKSDTRLKRIRTYQHSHKTCNQYTTATEEDLYVFNKDERKHD